MLPIWAFSVMLFLGCNVLAQTNQTVEASLEHACTNDLGCYMGLQDVVIIVTRINLVVKNRVELRADKELIANTTCTDLELPSITCDGLPILLVGNGHDLTIRGLNIKCPTQVIAVEKLKLESCIFNSINTDTFLPLPLLNLAATEVIIAKTVFIGNTIAGDLLRFENSNEAATVTNCKFENNTITHSTMDCVPISVIRKRYGTLAINGSLFQNNAVYSNGCPPIGLINAFDVDSGIIDSTAFVANTIHSTYPGCAVNIMAYNEARIQSSVFSKNICGSSIFSLSAQDANIENVYMEDGSIHCNSGDIPFPDATLIIKFNCAIGPFPIPLCSVSEATCCNTTFAFENYFYDHPCGGAMTTIKESDEVNDCTTTPLGPVPIVGGPTEVPPVDVHPSTEECIFCESICSIIANCSSDIVIVGDVVIDRDTNIDGDFTNNGKVTLVLRDNTKIKVAGCIVLGNFTVDVSNIDTSSSDRIPIIESTCVNGTVVVVGADECTSTSQEHDGNRFHLIFNTDTCGSSNLGIILGVVLGLVFIIAVAGLVIVLLVPSLREEVLPYAKNR